MPLQILIATILALVTLGGTLQSGSGRHEEVMIIGGDHLSQQLKNENSNIIVITTVVRSNRTIMVVGQKHEGEAKRIFTADTTLPVHVSNKHQKRNIIYRAA